MKDWKRIVREFLLSVVDDDNTSFLGTIIKADATDSDRVIAEYGPRLIADDRAALIGQCNIGLGDIHRVVLTREVLQEGIEWGGATVERASIVLRGIE